MKKLKNIAISAEIHSALSDHLDRKRVEVGREKTPTLAGFAENAILLKMRRESVDAARAHARRMRDYARRYGKLAQTEIAEVK